MTFNQFITQYLGKKIDFDGTYAGQCVDLFRQYVKEVLSFPQPKGVVGAKDFWTNYDSDPNLKNYYDKIPNTPTGVPQKGDVILWDKDAGGGYGHVAVFIEGDVNSFTSFDQNWPTLSKCTKTKHDYKNVLGWLRPKKAEPTPSPMPLKDTVINFDDAEGKRKTVGWYVREHAIEKQRANDAEWKAGELRDELDQVRAQNTEVVRGLNKRIRELNQEKEGLVKPTIINAFRILFGDLRTKKEVSEDGLSSMEESDN